MLLGKQQKTTWFHLLSYTIYVLVVDVAKALAPKTCLYTVSLLKQLSGK
jgi:hypothetical protein